MVSVVELGGPCHHETTDPNSSGLCVLGPDSGHPHLLGATCRGTPAAPVAGNGLSRPTSVSPTETASVAGSGVRNGGFVVLCQLILKRPPNREVWTAYVGTANVLELGLGPILASKSCLAALAQSHSFQPQTVRFAESPKCIWLRSETTLPMWRCASSRIQSSGLTHLNNEEINENLLMKMSSHPIRETQQSSGAMCSARMPWEQWSMTNDVRHECCVPHRQMQHLSTTSLHSLHTQAH